MVRTKFICNCVMPVAKANGEVDGYNVYLNAVYNNKNGEQSEENKEFWKYTPGGTIQFYTVNENAVKEFKQGKYYYVDFTESI